MSEIKTKRYFNCLGCEKGVFWIEHLIDQIPERPWGTWYCEACGVGHRGTAGNGECKVDLTGDKCLRTAVLLKLEPDAGDVYLTVRGMQFTKNGGVPDHARFEDGDRYHYNEHTCPTNYLRRVIEIFQVMPERNGKREESTDPHGIFEYVMTAPLYTGEGRVCDNVQDRLGMFKVPDLGWVLCPFCEMKGTPLPDEEHVDCGNCGCTFPRKDNLTTPVEVSDE
jgi:hypothetical protein